MTGIMDLLELAAVVAAACRVVRMSEMIRGRAQASSSPAAGIFRLAFLLNIRTPSPRLGRSCGGTEDNVTGDGFREILRHFIRREGEGMRGSGGSGPRWKVGG